MNHNPYGAPVAPLGGLLYSVAFSRKVRGWFTKTDRMPDPSAPD